MFNQSPIDRHLGDFQYFVTTNAFVSLPIYKNTLVG